LYQTGLAMPPFADRLDGVEVAQLVTYIRNAWGNRASGVTPKDVRDLRTKLREATH
jgi:mono/diheme cytochrome c family protein